MRLYYCFSVLISAFMIQGCVNKNNCTECPSEKGEMSFMNVNLAVDSIQNSLNQNYNHVEFPINLYEKLPFNLIVKNICSNKGQLIQIILNDTSTIKKEISLLAIQHLCINDYLPLVEKLYANYKQGKLAKTYFLYSMYTRLSNVLARDYENENLRKFIDKLLIDKNFTKIEKDYFRKIKSGEIWEGVKNSPTS